MGTNPKNKDGCENMTDEKTHPENSNIGIGQKRPNRDFSRRSVMGLFGSTLFVSGLLSGFDFEESNQSKDPGQAFDVSLTGDEELVDLADPFIGRAPESNPRWMLFPGSARPFGMVKLAPDNEMGDTLASGGDRYGGGYDPTRDWVHGFSHLHSWTIAGLSLIPRVGAVTNQRTPPKDSGTYPSLIDKDTESASPAHYEVRLSEHDINVELTTTTRAGFHRYTFPESGDAHIIATFAGGEYGKDIVDAEITKVSETEIEGYVEMDDNYGRGFQHYTHYFVIQTDKSFDSMDGWNGDSESDIEANIEKVSGDADRFGVALNFDTNEDEVINVKTGISFVSTESARNNLETEIGGFDSGPFGWDFDAVEQDARTEWNDLFGLVDVEMDYEGGDENLVKFYTGLFRSYASRTIMSDVNGKYVDMFEETRQLDDPEDPVYGSDAFWNTFWNLNQIWTLATPNITNKWVKSCLEIYDVGGWLPKGPAGIEYSGIMRGVHSIPFIVSAHQHGITDFDVNKAYEAVHHAMTTPGKNTAPGGGDSVGARNLQAFIEYGYIPADRGRTSDTMEIAYDNWCAGQLAEAVGQNEDARTFYRRGGYWRNTYDDEEVFFLRRRNTDGSWTVDFSEYDPLSSASVTEGTLWQYSWFVPHDVSGLVDLMGRDRYLSRLQNGFEETEERGGFSNTESRDVLSPYVNHGNQPNMQAAYLFNYAGEPWRTQKWVRVIMNEYYGVGLGGYPGDEDQGQMGGWFVMSALGLFQTDGGCRSDPIFEIGSPLVSEATIQLDDEYYSGEELIIRAENNSTDNKYIQSAEFNGEELNKPWIRADRLLSGGELVFEMGSEPNEEWGAGMENAPPSDIRSPPTDLDGDGLWEDVDGDGELTRDDAEELFDSFNDPVVQNNPERFDFNDNGRVDRDDIVELFEEVGSND